MKRKIVLILIMLIMFVIPNPNVIAATDEITYSIHFDGNGATSGSMQDMTNLKTNKTYRLRDNKFEKK